MLRAGWLALCVFVWIIGAFLGSTFEYQSSVNGQGISYTTGSANVVYGSAAVVGNGTTWDNATMAGSNFKIDLDGTWYRVSAVVNATHLTLASPYNGSTANLATYTMAASAGWAGTGTGGYGQSPVDTFTYLTNFDNVFQRDPIFNKVTLPLANSEYFETLWKVITWDWSFMNDYRMIYWIFCAPFVCMGVLSLILIAYGVITGNLHF